MGTEKQISKEALNILNQAIITTQNLCADENSDISNEEQKNSDLMCKYLSEFFTYIQYSPYYDDLKDFVNYTDYCGMCLILRPYDTNQAKILPYLLTAYLYNSKLSQLNKKFLEALDSENKKDICTPNLIWGANRKEYWELIPYSFPSFTDVGVGIGYLFHGDTFTSGRNYPPEVIATCLRFYTKSNICKTSSRLIKKLCMYPQQKPGYFSDYICPNLSHHPTQLPPKKLIRNAIGTIYSLI